MAEWRGTACCLQGWLAERGVVPRNWIRVNPRLWDLFSPARFYGDPTWPDDARYEDVTPAQAARGAQLPLVGGAALGRRAAGGAVVIRWLAVLSCATTLAACDGNGPRCDTRRIAIGMTRAEVLAACPAPEQEWYRDGRDKPYTYKFANGAEETRKPELFMRWHGAADGVSFVDGRVDWIVSEPSR